MFSLQSRKQNTNFIIDKTIQFLQLFNKDDYLNFLIVISIHILIVITIIFGLYLFPMGFTFYLILFCWLLLIVFHLYFNGCIFIKIERKLLNSPSWYGLWYILLNNFKNITLLNKIKLANSLSITGYLIISCIIFYKIIK